MPLLLPAMSPLPDCCRGDELIAGVQRGIQENQRRLFFVADAHLHRPKPIEGDWLSRGSTLRRDNRAKSDGRPAFFAHATANISIIAMATGTFLEKRVAASKKVACNRARRVLYASLLAITQGFIM
jgi:hypothetical protein